MPELGDLRRQIEELALAVVMEEPAPEWIPAFESVREKAQREGAGQVAAAAAAVLDRVRETGRAAELQVAIAGLEEALRLDEQIPAAPVQPLAQDPELVRDFILESREHLAAIETHALILERDPQSADALNAVFRGFHTIKGLAGFLELWEIQRMAHEVETVLDRARNSQLTIAAETIDIVLEGADDLRCRLSHVEAQFKGEPSLEPPANEPLLARIRALSSEPAAEPRAAGIAGMAAAVEGASAAHPETAAGRESRPDETMAVRVDTSKLDYLVDMAGEMVIAQSLVRHDPELTAAKSPRLQRNLAQLARITAELQKTAMSMRLVPIGPLFRRMARLVRDLSRQFGKPIEMETQGDEIELDRNIVQELKDPLMHMVRNALDHGVESPAEREKAGKNPVAKLLLSGRHHAGQVVIEISDDGRGLDREKIVNRAVEKGLISSGEGLSDSEAQNLIFLPGFTTASQVTSVSGRGVGMDVVRKHIERLRGRVEIRSSPGRGTTFALKLPLTLAIIEGLVVAVGQERYIAPLFAVREVLRPGPETMWTVQERSEMALIRGELIPVLRLYRKFHVAPRCEDPMESVLLVAEVEGRPFALMVDELIGKQEVVIKSLGETFKGVTGVAGGAILGDGRVGLILDVERIYRTGRDEAGR